MADATDLASETSLNLLLRSAVATLPRVFVSLLLELFHLCTTAKLKFSCMLDNSVFQPARLAHLAVALQARLTVSALVTRLFSFTVNERWLFGLA